MKFKSILFALLLSLAAVATATERVENATLYQVSEIDGRKTLVYDGYRTAPIADDVYVSDATGEGVDSVAKLADALGKEPDWTALKLGDVVALGPASALVATVETRDGAVSAIAVTHRFARPLIGVSIVLKDGYSAGQQTIVQTLLRCGANVYLIPKIAKEEECDAYLPQLDGFVMPGGTNANPRLFGEVPYPHGSSKIDDVRDVNDAGTLDMSRGPVPERRARRRADPRRPELSRNARPQGRNPLQGRGADPRRRSPRADRQRPDHPVHARALSRQGVRNRARRNAASDRFGRGAGN